MQAPASPRRTRRLAHRLRRASRDSRVKSTTRPRTAWIERRHDLGHRHVWQLFRKKIPENYIPHIAGILNCPPLAGADDGVRSFARPLDDDLNVLLMHESVIGPDTIFFSVAQSFAFARMDLEWISRSIQLISAATHAMPMRKRPGHTASTGCALQCLSGTGSVWLSVPPPHTGVKKARLRGHDG